MNWIRCTRPSPHCGHADCVSMHRLRFSINIDSVRCVFIDHYFHLLLSIKLLIDNSTIRRQLWFQALTNWMTVLLHTNRLKIERYGCVRTQVHGITWKMHHQPHHRSFTRKVRNIVRRRRADPAMVCHGITSMKWITFERVHSERAKIHMCGIVSINRPATNWPAIESFQIRETKCTSKIHINLSIKFLLEDKLINFADFAGAVKSRTAKNFQLPVWSSHSTMRHDQLYCEQ